MFDAITNPSGTLLVIHFSDIVEKEQTKQAVTRIQKLMEQIQPGFTTITDLGRLTHMDFECAEDIGQIMDICNRAKVAQVYRVIPSPDVDIGWQILTHLHYDQASVRINSYPSLYQAMKCYLSAETA